MKIILVVAIMATVAAVANAACSTVENCDTCSNPGPQCLTCVKGTIMSTDMKQCIDCGLGCSTCTADASNKVTCSMCTKGYYLKAGACTQCDAGCAECSLGADGKTVTCNMCMTEAYAAATDTTGKITGCTACPSQCKTCTVQADLTTKCSACYDYKGLTKQGYFLKTSDKSCSACPSYCESCTDNGSGTGICKSCYATYVALVDPADATKDKTSCLKCPTDCRTCTGEKIGSVATCTDCVADKGLYVSSGACITCNSPGGKTCTTQGAASACKSLYRLDTDTCTACPAWCEDCPKDSAGTVTTCADCKDNYGPKLISSKTCDFCGISNCETCSRNGLGAFSCSACKTGYAIKSSTECGSCPSSCHSTHGCSYASSTYSCLTGCKDSTYTNVPSSGVCSLCTTADASCSACGWSGSTVQCTACTLPKVINGTSDLCVTNPDPNGNCKVANADGSACTTCNDGFSEVAADGITCVACTDSVNCVTCNDTVAGNCKSCKSGYIASDATYGGTCYTCEDITWGSGSATGVANCATCAWNGASVECATCKTGFLRSSDKRSCVANVDTLNTKCTSLSGSSLTNCGTCLTGYGPVTSLTNCPRCNDGNCATCAAETGSEKKCTTCNAKYITTDGAGGECKPCPSKCNTCTWDSGNSKTICGASQCEQYYTQNPDMGTCDACPADCATCEWDSTNKVVICSVNLCKTTFGRIGDKSCKACPGNCASCSLSSAPDADDTLFCDTCSNSYAKNSDVCALCPSNCEHCSDNKGTMECSECNDKYALDSSTKLCVKCPTDCNKCSASAGTVKCSECAIGFSLAVDMTACTDCATAAFANCGNCTSTDAASGKANCTACSSGFALEDGYEFKSCIDLASLTCGQGTSRDAPPQCSACSTGFTATKDLLCSKKCYSCGDAKAGTYVDKAKCSIPAAGANATANDATQIECLSGICYAVHVNGMVAAGCLPSNDAAGTCTGTRAAGETCSTAAKITKCEQCCSTALCNTFVATMDGSADDATTTSINFLVLAAAALVAMRLY